MEGEYTGDPGFAPQITRSNDGTRKVFNADLHERLLTGGRWSGDGSTLRIESTAGSCAFVKIEIGDGCLVLGRGDERWVLAIQRGIGAISDPRPWPLEPHGAGADPRYGGSGGTRRTETSMMPRR